MSDDARVPFSAIGVLLILFSVSISTFILKADIEMAKVILSENSDYAFFFAISDLERALNYAGVFSLHEVGKSPIMNSSMKNFERAIFLAEEKFSELVKMNYQNDSFIYEDKIINAERIGDIEFSPLVMNLSRKFSPPILKPREKYETYYIASAPLILSMKEIGKEQMEISREIDSPILSRYPLLKELIQEWEERLRNEVMIQSTAFFQGITLAKGYSQYFLGKPKNVVSNDDLSLLINGVLLLDQVWVFNSVDSGALEEYLLRAGKIEPVISPLQAAGEEYEIMKEELISAKPVVDYVYARVDEEIERIARDVYTAEFQLDVKREMIFYKEGSHEPCNTDLGAGRWEVESFSCDSLEMDERRVGGKDCRISYSRLHEWKLPKTCRKTVCSGEGEERRCKKVSYDCSIYCSAKDERKDEVKVEVRVNWYSKYLLGMEECHKERDFDEDKCEFSVFCERKGRELKDDISDVFHAKIYDGIYDRNLEDVAENYLRNYYEPNWRTVVSYCGIDGRCPSDFPFRRRITGEVPQEIKLVARHLIDEMKREHEQIKLDEKINFESCPVPSELLKAASRDFILKIEGADVQKHLEDGRFRAASAKVIWISANWWVNELKKEILSSFGDGARMAEEKLGKIKSSSIMNLAKSF